MVFQVINIVKLFMLLILKKKKDKCLEIKCDPFADNRDPVTGCAFKKKTCDDSNDCTIDTCNENNGKCKFENDNEICAVIVTPPSETSPEPTPRPEDPVIVEPSPTPTEQPVVAAGVAVPGNGGNAGNSGSGANNAADVIGNAGNSGS